MTCACPSQFEKGSSTTDGGLRPTWKKSVFIAL